MKKLILSFFFFISLSSNSQNLQYDWSAKVGDPLANVGLEPIEVVIDEHNNKIICGRFSGTHDFDPGPGVFQMTSQTNTNASTIYVMKLDSMNNFVWANNYGTTGSLIWNSGLVVDSAGSVYTYGFYEGDLFYDPQNSFYYVSSNWWYSDSYIHKLDTNGNFEWIKSWGANPVDHILSMKIDEEQNFYLLGYFNDSTDVDIGSGTYMVNEFTPASDKYLAKYDSDFNLLWVKQYAGTGFLDNISMSLDANDEITITGKYKGIVDFDLNAGTDIDTSFLIIPYDMFTHVMDRSGNHKWHHTIKGVGNQYNVECVLDSHKNRYIYGLFYNTMDFNPGGVQNIIEFAPQQSNFADSYIIKLDSVGNQIWAKAIQGENSYEIHGLKMQSEQLIVFGSVSDKTDLDPNSGFILVEPPLVVNSLLFIEKLDSNANVLWHEEFMGTSNLYIVEFEFDTNNNYFIVGHLEGNVDIDPGPNDVQLSNYPGSATFFAIFGELPCSQLGTDLSSPINATCSTLGGVTANGIYGAPPYSFTWLTNPQSNSPNLITDTCGLYFVVATDANGCIDTNSVYIDGPVSGSSIDLDVNLVTTNFVQGQAAMIWLDAYNGGCQQISGTAMLVLDPLVQYDSASVTPTSIIGDSLIWDLAYGNNDSTHFMVTIFATTSQTAVSGDTVCFLAQVNPFIGDSDTLNNEKVYCEPIFASYDPNDKKVFPKGLCDDNVYLGDALTYTVRFQNTGNSEAIHVNIIDFMDINLDLSTFKVLGQSHTGLSVNHMGGRELQFNFQNIHLPDSTSDPIGSNGYVIFEILPKEGIAVNTTVSNEVKIFFDFNSPIITNTVTTTFTNDIPCIHIDDLNLFELEQSNFTVYPNPTNGIFTVNVSEIKTTSISVFNTMGEEVYQTKCNGNKAVVDLKKAANGVYFIQVITDTGVLNQRIVKQ